MKRRKKGIQLLILLVLLLVSIAGYYFLQYTNHKKEKEKADAEAAKTITLDSVSQDKIASFSFQNDKTTYKFQKTKDAWGYETDSNFPVDESKITSLVGNLETVKATRFVEDGKANYEEFGLNAPSNVITITDTDGKTITYTIGNLNPVTSEYYVTVSGKDSVYMISNTIPNAFAVGLYDLVKMDAFPVIDKDNIYHMAGTLKDMSLDFSRDAAKSASGTDTITWKNAVNGGQATNVDNTKMDSLLSAIGSLTYDSEVEYNCPNENLENYGLDNPQLSLTIDYFATHQKENTDSISNSDSEEGNSTYTTQESITIYVGAVTADGGFYVKTDKSNAVYVVKGSIADQITSIVNGDAGSNSSAE